MGGCERGNLKGKGERIRERRSAGGGGGAVDDGPRRLERRRSPERRTGRRLTAADGTTGRGGL